MNFNQLANGWILEMPTYTVFFGQKNSESDKLRTQFKKFEFKRVKQVHGVQIIQADSNTPDLQIEADGMMTEQKGLALCSITADCMPVIIVHKEGKIAMALHAGWRGVAQRIVPLGIEKLMHKKFRPEDFDVYLGPHILKSSFEIQDDALALLRPSTKLPEDAYTTRISNLKFRADLLKIVSAQVQEFGIQEEQIRNLPIDTVTAPHFHSFRRDAKEAGRQISFVVLKSQI